MRLRLKAGNATRDVAAGRLWAAARTADFTLDLGGVAHAAFRLVPDLRRIIA